MPPSSSYPFIKPLRSNKSSKVDRSETAFHAERNRIRIANDEKTARLRGLRLAKEAAEREAAAAFAAANPVDPNLKPRARKKAKPKQEQLVQGELPQVTVEK